MRDLRLNYTDIKKEHSKDFFRFATYFFFLAYGIMETAPLQFEGFGGKCACPTPSEQPIM